VGSHPGSRRKKKPGAKENPGVKKDTQNQASPGEIMNPYIKGFTEFEKREKRTISPGKLKGDAEVRKPNNQGLPVSLLKTGLELTRITFTGAVLPVFKFP